MDNSEELKNLTFNNKFHAGKNHSESDVRLKRLSIIPEDETVDADLRVVGFNVKVDGDKAYSFAVEKARSKSADTFTTLDIPNRIFGSNAPASHRDECREVRNFFKVPNVDEQFRFHDNLTNIKSPERVKSPVLQLNFANENKEFELHLRTKNDDRSFTSEKERKSSKKVSYNAVDLLSGTGTPSCLQASSGTPEVPLKYVIELSSRKVQTEKETESSSAQTADVEVNYPKTTLEEKVQTDERCDASTSTECKKVASVKVETEENPKKEASLQTDIETATGSSQTETAAVFSIDRVYAASTQTDELANAATLTDFNIYIVDRENISEKAIDTEDLPYAPLMVAREEREEAVDKPRDVRCCHCSCNLQNPQENSYESCSQKESEAVSETNLVKSDNQPSTTGGISTFNNYSCRSGRSSKQPGEANVTKACQQSGSQDKNLTPRNDSKVAQEAVETLKPPDFFLTPEMNYSSFALRENISSKSEVEVVKNLISELQKMKLIVAIREQTVCKVERATPLKKPVIFQHFLNSFSLSVYSPPRVVINPISISLAVDHPHDMQTNISKSQNLISQVELPSDGGLKTKNQANLLVCDSMDKSSMTISCLPPTMVVENEKSQVCLCNSCYSRVQSVLDDKRKRILHQGSETASLQGGKVSGMVKERLASTSPKIKCKKFHYMSTDAWRLYEETQEDVLSGKIEATNIFHVGDSDSDESIESNEDIDLNSACEAVNDHLLNLRPVDKDTVRKAAEVLHKAWFETAASKHSDPEEVKYYLRYFEEFSDNLLRTLLYSVDNNGNNILHFAFANNRFDLVEEFLKNKFSAELLKKTNKSGNSPLMICAISLPKTESDWSVIRKCMQQGDVNSKSLKSGQTPLMNAASCGFHEMVDVLLDVGANPNLQDKDGSTALMYAAEHGHESCIKTIVRHNKCDLTLKDKDGQTACSIALSNGNKNIAVLIHMHALEKRQISKHSQSPRRYAWTNNESRNRAQRIKPMSPSIHSSEVH